MESMGEEHGNGGQETRRDRGIEEVRPSKSLSHLHHHDLVALLEGRVQRDHVLVLQAAVQEHLSVDLELVEVADRGQCVDLEHHDLRRGLADSLVDRRGIA